MRTRHSLSFERALYGAAIFVCTLAFGFAAQAQTSKAAIAAENSASQGCVNQGSDRRIAAPVICWAQRQLSWKSGHQPHFLLIGNHDRTNLGLAWPPYLVYNSPDGNGRWRMFRIGFRYDRNWRGYIFPTVAWKRVAAPLRY